MASKRPGVQWTTTGQASGASGCADAGSVEQRTRPRRLAAAAPSAYHTSVPAAVRRGRRRPAGVAAVRAAVLVTDIPEMLSRSPSSEPDERGTTPSGAAAPVRARELFLAHLPLLERIVGAACRRSGVAGDDADDVASYVKTRLVSDDYAILRKFRGDASVATFLTSVIERLTHDFWTERWGKWRPSAAAKRGGAWAVRLEQLVVRDGCPWREAVERVRSAIPDAPEERELFAFVSSLQDRGNVRRPERLTVDAIASESAEERVEEAEAEDRRHRLLDALAQSFALLPVDDRLLLRMRFWDDCKVADIARALSLEQKPLYRRFEAILGDIGDRLRAGGVDEQTVRRMLDDALPDDPDADWSFT